MLLTLFEVSIVRLLHSNKSLSHAVVKGVGGRIVDDKFNHLLELFRVSGEEEIPVFRLQHSQIFRLQLSLDAVGNCTQEEDVREREGERRKGRDRKRREGKSGRR